MHSIKNHQNLNHALRKIHAQKKSHQNLNHAHRSLSARWAMVFYHRDQCAGHQTIKKPSPTMTKTSFPRRAFICGHSINIIYSYKANARVLFLVITWQGFIIYATKQAGKKGGQGDLLTTQGFYKYNQSSQWNRPESNQ